jgi:hypothetical protein
MIVLVVVLLLLLNIAIITCYQNGDRISAMSMTIHDGVS